ncbi:glycoside hydrolase family 2 protein [Hymenobacter volaticus]|uniref:Beta-glucuronidase n=1 Tax=Hymenobacter volaticus TaxID=2932254 RepID=A0ABY4G3M3_9BACT|nr:glycoside hydrolase family 2 TIM barrel-domain containing protein [Hymenobacter volaticus]UOQ65468.1 beta-glucuronidase [Hymenobacter volaticus]
MNYHSSKARIPYLLLALLSFGWGSTFAQTASLITNIDHRATTSLNGKWKIIVDPYETGFYSYRMVEDPNGFFKDRKPKDATELVEYNFDTSDELYVPSDWNSQREDLKLYEGTIWYKKAFDYTKKAATNRVFVHFGAVNYDAHVYLNGKKIGHHVGGFTPFNMEVTDLLQEKGNFIVVKADDKRLKEAVPTPNTDWWNYGGITRDVKLVEVPATFVEDYTVQLAKGSLNKLDVWVKTNGTSPQPVTVSIPEAKVKLTGTPDASGMVKLSSNAKLKLWSPESPKLYKVQITSGSEKVEDEIGFRSIETKGADILLNKKPVLLKGICIHEEMPTRGARAYSMEDAQTLLGWAKELGCNYVRLAHYPHNENMTRLADKMGLMVWSEIPVYWTVDWANPATLANAKQQLTEMITRDKNKASVVLWSMANETPLSDSRLSFLKSQIETARQLDNTRLITAALEVHNATENTMMIDDPLGQYLDVLGCNEYIGWYSRKIEDCDKITWQTTYDKPLIISETGADCVAGMHGEATARFTEEFQDNFYQHQLAMIKRIPFLRGVTPWILADFRSPRRPLPSIQDYWNRKGLISDRGERKKAFYTLQKFYADWKLK